MLFEGVGFGFVQLHLHRRRRTGIALLAGDGGRTGARASNWRDWCRCHQPRRWLSSSVVDLAGDAPAIAAGLCRRVRPIESLPSCHHHREPGASRRHRAPPAELQARIPPPAPPPPKVVPPNPSFARLVASPSATTVAGDFDRREADELDRAASATCETTGRWLRGRSRRTSSTQGNQLVGTGRNAMCPVRDTTVGNVATISAIGGVCSAAGSGRIGCVAHRLQDTEPTRTPRQINCTGCDQHATLHLEVTGREKDGGRSHTTR